MKTNAVTIVIWHNFDASQQSYKRTKFCGDFYVFFDFFFTCKLSMVEFYLFSKSLIEQGTFMHNLSNSKIAYFNIMTSECPCYWLRQYLKNGSERWVSVRCQNRFHTAGCNMVDPMLVKRRRHEAFLFTMQYQVHITIVTPKPKHVKPISESPHWGKWRSKTMPSNVFLGQWLGK